MTAVTPGQGPVGGAAPLAVAPGALAGAHAGTTSRVVQHLDGLLIGTAAAAVSGVLWWAFATITEFEQWPYGAPIVGLITGFGVLLGTRRGGVVAGIEAFVLAALAVAVAVYFIDRSFTITAIAESGRAIDVPLWQGFSFVRELYQSWWDFDRQQVLAWCSAPFAALAVAGWPSRRAPGA